MVAMKYRRLLVCSVLLLGVILITGLYNLSPEVHGHAPRRDVTSFLNKLRNASPDTDDINSTLADGLRSKVRVLCLVLTMESVFDTQARAVKYTWARRCDKYFFVFTTWRRSPDIIPTNVTESRRNIVYKIRQALQFIYTNFIDDFDWLLKADDDTYVIMENLRYLLSKYDATKPGHMGYHYNKFMAQGFMSGGAGYVISNSAVRMLVRDGINTRSCDVERLKLNQEYGEDLHVGFCLQKLGVPVLSSLDSKNRETFHPDRLESHLFGVLPVYVDDMAKHKPKVGPECCSRFTISYHYVTPEVMVVMEHLLYKTSVYGRNILSDTDRKGSAFKVGTVIP